MAPISIAPPLREVAELKIDHFNQLKEDFKARYGIGVPTPSSTNLVERIATLVQNIRQFDPYLEEDGDLTLIAQHLENIRNSCVSHDKLVNLEEQIVDKLHKQLSRYETTSLHLDLMKEVMLSQQPESSPSSALDAMSIEDDFEVVDDRLEALWEKFEAEAFTAKEVDVDCLEAYLAGLMEESKPRDSLGELRHTMRQHGDDILEGETQIEEDELEWCIMDLLEDDLISPDKKKTLEGYIQNQVAMKELLGILNMKSVRQWDWKRTGKGIPVTARPDTHGQYHITVEEDLFDTLYLHCVAINWAQKLKECLSDYIRYTSRSHMRTLSTAECKERDEFLVTKVYEPPLLPKSRPEPSEHRGIFPMPPPPPPPPPPPGPPPPPVMFPPMKSGTKKKSSRAYAGLDFVMPPPPPPPFQIAHHLMLSQSDTVDSEKHRVYRQDFFMSRLPTQDGWRPQIIPPKEVQANLIKTLAADMRLGAAFGNQPTCSVVEFHSVATALPHKTVLAVLRFLGVPGVFTDFFARYLAVDLNIGPSVRGTRDRILTRACGVPERHGMGLLFTEAVMFFADLAALKRINLPMYRLGSTCFFLGTEEQCVALSQELTVFSEHTKLDFDDVSVDPERLHIGFLELAGDVFTIKQSAVEAYARQVKKHLSSQNTVYDWVRVWNETMGTYAAHMFGPLVELFGQSHLQSVKAAYLEMFNIIFDGGLGLTHHVKGMLCERSDHARASSPLSLEAMIYLPHSFGGLGVKNPLIALNLARDLASDPNAVVRQYLDAEAEYYELALSNWSARVADRIPGDDAVVFPDSKDQENVNAGSGDARSCNAKSGPAAFMTKQAVTQHREYALYPLLDTRPISYLIQPAPPDFLDLYQDLFKEPVANVIASERVKDKARESGPCKRWEKLSGEQRWILTMYGDECLEQYGGLEIWCERYVPTICMALARGLEGMADEDATTDSTMSSVV